MSALVWLTSKRDLSWRKRRLAITVGPFTTVAVLHLGGIVAGTPGGRGAS